MARQKPQLKITTPTERQARTEQAQAEQQALPHIDLPAAAGRTVDKTRALGIGLKESEIRALDVIAEATGVARNSLCRRAVRDFIKRYAAGEIDINALVDTEAPQPKKRLRMD